MDTKYSEGKITFRIKKHLFLYVVWQHEHWQSKALSLFKESCIISQLSIPKTLGPIPMKNVYSTSSLTRFVSAHIVLKHVFHKVLHFATRLWNHHHDTVILKYTHGLFNTVVFQISICSTLLRCPCPNLFWRDSQYVKKHRQIKLLYYFLRPFNLNKINLIFLYYLFIWVIHLGI